MKIAIIILSILISTTLSIHSKKSKGLFYSDIPRLSIRVPENSKDLKIIESLDLVGYSNLGVRVKPKEPLTKPFNTYFVQDAFDKKEKSYTLPYQYIRSIIPPKDQEITKYDFITLIVSEKNNDVRASIRFYFPLLFSKSYRNDFLENVTFNLNRNGVKIDEIKKEINGIINEYDKLFDIKSDSTKKDKEQKEKDYLRKEVQKLEETLNAKKQEIKKTTLALVKLDGEQVQLSKKLKEQREALEKKEKGATSSLKKMIAKKIVGDQKPTLMTPQLQKAASKFEDLLSSSLFSYVNEIIKKGNPSDIKKALDEI